MSFPESLKEQVKNKANRTCCWCQDRTNPVEVHHIRPEADGGPDTEDNAAPLCSNCHTLLGANPTLRKEIKGRRDLWYEMCEKTLNPQFGWPIGLDVPLLDFNQPIPSTSAMPFEGIQLTDRNSTDDHNPPLLYLSIYFKKGRYFGPSTLWDNEKWLLCEANMRFAFNLRIQVRAWNDRDVLELMRFLTKGNEKYLPEFLRGADDKRLEPFRQSWRGWSLQGPLPDNKDGAGDYLYIWREDEENRLIMSTFTPTCAGVSIHARLSDRMIEALAEYLETSGFVEF